MPRPVAPPAPLGPGGTTSAHQFCELAEEVAGVVGPRASLGVVLHRERRDVRADETFDYAVVEVYVADLDGFAEGARGHRVIVVLAGYFDRTGSEAPDGMVAAVVAEGQFVGRSAEGLGEDLVAQAYAEHGQLPSSAPTVSVAPTTAAGSPGPLERNTPSGAISMTSAAGVLAGTTVTVAIRARLRRMLRFIPKS